MNEQELYRTLEKTNRVNPYTVYELRNLLDSSAPDLSVQTAAFRGQQGRISRPVRAILSGRL